MARHGGKHDQTSWRAGQSSTEPGLQRPLGTGRSFTLALLAGFAVLTISYPVSAQQTPAQGYTPARPTGPSIPKAAAAPKTAAKSDLAAQSAPQATGESGLRNRIEQLEEQLVEMQVAIGTLESLSKGGSSSSGVYRGNADNAGSGGADPGKVAALEIQVRALATQVDQLTQQIRQMSGGRSVSGAPAAVATNANAAAPDTSDPINRLVGNGAPPQPATTPLANATSLPQSGASDASAKQAYETAYGHLLQQDFASAETAFDDFLKRFPSDPLAGNAQYWLGETYFARGQYKPAAGAFLKGYQTYTRSAKAPDSVLKLAMSLDKLGQKDAACASYAELTTKFPNAPGHVKNRADTERRRLGCV